MLHGKTPWRARTEKELISKIKREAMTVDESLKLSSKTTNLLRRCLAVSVSNRIKPDDLFEFFQEEPAKNLKYSSESK
jgi:serine/threonine protein kinase